MLAAPSSRQGSGKRGLLIELLQAVGVRAEIADADGDGRVFCWQICYVAFWLGGALVSIGN